MGYKVGMPVMKLDKNSHFGKSNSRSGNARAVANEALEERRCSDADLDKSKTAENLYWMDRADGRMYFKSGEKLVDYWEQMADSYRVVDRNGKEKKLRSDAGIGMAGICKPEKAFMDTLSYDKQVAFLEDSAKVIHDIYARRGILMDAVVLHFDEGNPHLHYFCHDPEYKLGKKLGLPLFRALNDTEYPEQMRQKGWDIASLKGYDVEAAKAMTEDELSEYKAKHKAQRKKGGKPSAVFKAEKDAERIIGDAQAQVQIVMKRQEELDEQQNKREKTLDAREKRLEAQEAALKQKASKFDAEYEKRLKMVDEVMVDMRKAYNSLDGQARHRAYGATRSAVDAYRRLPKGAEEIMQTGAQHSNAMDSYYGL